MGDVVKGRPKRGKYVWYVSSHPQRKDIIQKINLSSLKCCLYQLKCRVGSIQRLCSITWHVGKVQMPLTTYRWWRPQRCQPQAKARLPTLWETRNWAAGVGQKTDVMCVLTALLFPWEKKILQGSVFHHPGVCPYINSKEQQQFHPGMVRSQARMQ